MSLTGSNPNLTTMGRRSNSRQDLAFSRNDMGRFGGNGYQGDYAVEGGYAHKSFSRHTVAGGGGGGGTMKVPMAMAMGSAGPRYEQSPVSFKNFPPSCRRLKL